MCHVENVQLHHIRYISDNGDNSYENLIPLCPNCHSKVHMNQAAQGAPGVITRAITLEQLKVYKKDWINNCKNLVSFKSEFTNPSNWHYY